MIRSVLAGTPLIVTAELPDDLHAFATNLRDRHFPRERNFLAAHVTLFHAIPPSAEAELGGHLSRIARDNARVPARLLGIMSLGRGTALRIESPAMLVIRERIADHFHGSLSAQDQHRPRLHVTIQNKVTLAEAKSLQAELTAQVQQQSFNFRGLAMHAYAGGPWIKLREWSFRGAQRG